MAEVIERFGRLKAALTAKVHGLELHEEDRGFVISGKKSFLIVTKNGQVALKTDNIQRVKTENIQQLVDVISHLFEDMLGAEGIPFERERMAS